MSILMKLKYLKKETKNGIAYWYYRRKGMRQKLRGIPGEPEFMTDYAHAHAGYAVPVAKVQPIDKIILENTFRALAVDYMKSDEYTSLAANSKRAYRQHIDLSCKIFGNAQADEITMQDILQVRDNLSNTPAKANEFCKTTKVIFGWGVPRGRVSRNPADFRGTSVKKLKTGEWLPWPEEMLEHFLSNTEEAVHQVIMMCLYTGQRISDVLTMKHGDIQDDETIYVRQQKTGKELYIPLHPDLKKMLNNMDRHSTHILVSPTRLVWTYKNWNRKFRAERKRLSGEGFVTHGLRKNAIIRLLLAGCTTQQAGSITGQSDEMVSYYARKINQRLLARQAMDKYSAWTNQEQVSAQKVVNLKSGENE